MFPPLSPPPSPSTDYRHTRNKNAAFLPESRWETAGRNAIFVYHLLRAVQCWRRRCGVIIAAAVAHTSHRIAAICVLHCQKIRRNTISECCIHEYVDINKIYTIRSRQNIIHILKKEGKKSSKLTKKKKTKRADQRSRAAQWWICPIIHR